VRQQQEGFNMPTEIDPIIGSWYQHLDKGQLFQVVALDEDNGVIEIQHFDGDIEEITLDEWRESELDMAEEPEDWSGAVDISEKDDFGTEITDTEDNAWSEPLREIRPKRE
jgi:hypothetical protein